MNKKSILGYAVGPVGTALLSFVSLPMVAWFFTIEDLGKISMLQVAASLSVLVFCLGLDQAYVREYHESKDKPKLFQMSFIPGVLLLVLTFVGLYSIDETLVSRWLYGVDSLSLSIISLCCFLIVYCSRFLSLILRMQDRSLAYSMSQILPKLFFLLFVLSIVWLGYSKDLYSLVAAHAVSILTAFLLFAWNTRREWRSSFLIRFSWSELHVLLRFGFPLVLGGLASWGLSVMDRVSLRALSSFSELGLYSVAVGVASGAAIFAGIFNTIWAPLVYKWVSEEDADFAKIDKVTECLLAAIYFIVVISGLLSWLLPYFLPIEYIEIQYLITACVLGPLLYTLSEVTGVGIPISRKTYYSMYASIIAMLVNLGGNYLLVPLLGASGAAISTVVSFWIFFMLRTEFSKVVWRSLNTKKEYIETLILVCISVLQTFVVGSLSNALFVVWFLLFVFGFFLHTKATVLLLDFVKVQIKFISVKVAK